MFTKRYRGTPFSPYPDPWTPPMPTIDEFPNSWNNKPRFFMKHYRGSPTMLHAIDAHAPMLYIFLVHSCCFRYQKHHQYLRQVFWVVIANKFFLPFSIKVHNNIKENKVPLWKRTGAPRSFALACFCHVCFNNRFYFLIQKSEMKWS